MADLLDKTYGSRRSQGQLTRNKEAFRQLDEGKLQPGELFGLATGAPAVGSPTDKNPVLVSGRRTDCLTCHGPLEQHGPPLASQPRRCQVCGQLKRRAHNERLKQKREQGQGKEPDSR